MLIMVCYFKKICGINQAEDLVTWPDLLHRHTSALASFREWSVVSAWLRIQAQPRNPCQPHNSASASTWSSRRRVMSTQDKSLLMNLMPFVSQLTARRLEPHYNNEDKCITGCRKWLYWAGVIPKYVLELHLAWMCKVGVTCTQKRGCKMVTTKLWNLQCSTLTVASAMKNSSGLWDLKIL